MVKIERPRVFKTELPNQWGEGEARFWMEYGVMPRTKKEALLMSILKWHILCWFYRNDMRPNFSAVYTCGLCVFQDAFCRGCDGCLIFQETGMRKCNGTPLVNFENEIDFSDIQVPLKNAQAELRFLKNLYHKLYGMKKGQPNADTHHA